MKITSYSQFGYDGCLVTVDTEEKYGIPSIDIVGLSEGEVNGALERMKSAISNSGLEFPSERILISLSPVDVKKDGCVFDLSMAASVLSHGRKFIDDDVLVLGGLELNGNVRAVCGVTAAVSSALGKGIRHCIVPVGNLEEAKACGINVAGVSTLFEAVEALSGNVPFMNGDVNETSIGVEFSTEHDESVNGLKAAKSALETAALSAAGGFHTLLVGHPGCGKTLLASGLMSAITPNLTREESQTVARIHSLAGLAGNEGIKMDAPFRMPHQTASIEGMFGGGMCCKPGEISLAHNGVLFLDEAAEFRSSVLQMLRVPLESKSITLSRAGRSTVYPADFQLIMTANPCPCGNYGSEEKICLCSARAVEQYWRKFSGPLLDRISVKYNFDEHCNEEKVPVNLEELRDRVRTVIEHSRKNFGKKIQALSAEELSRHASLSAEANNLLGTKTAGFSERCRMNVIRVALCSAVMDGRDEIDEADIGKALSFTVDFTLGIHF